MPLIPRIVHATLSERFIFNYRQRPEELAKHLPVKWLKPQVFNGWSVTSFCILKLKQVVIWPFPRFLGMETTSCAYRCGVIDTSSGTDVPTVYVTDRNTDLSIIPRLGPGLLADSYPMIRPSIEDSGDSHIIRVPYLDGEELFAAEAKERPSGQFISQVFPTLADFSAFIHSGVLSYAPSFTGMRSPRST